MLGSLLFILFIIDINDGISSKISKFTDDTKLGRTVGDEAELRILQEDLRRMFRWSTGWQKIFNLEKCSVMHMENRNNDFSYEMWRVRH